MNRQLFINGRNTVGGGHSARVLCLGDRFPVILCQRPLADQVETGSTVDDPAHQVFVGNACKTVKVPKNVSAQFVRDQLCQSQMPCGLLRVDIGPSHLLDVRPRYFVGILLGDGVALELDAVGSPESDSFVLSRGCPSPVELLVPQSVLRFLDRAIRASSRSGNSDHRIVAADWNGHAAGAFSIGFFTRALFF